MEWFVSNNNNKLVIIMNIDKPEKKQEKNLKIFMQMMFVMKWF